MDIFTLSFKPDVKEISEEVSKVKKELNSDMFFYNASLTRVNADNFISLIKSNKQNKNVCLFITTNGGDIDCTYKITRYLIKQYEFFRLYVFGPCKSAGTLLALGANEIIMDENGEFGPLDVQVFSPDEFIQRSSGFSIYQSLEYIGKKSFELFEDIFIQIRARSGGIITTQTASEIASKIAVGLYAPITQQIDPSRIGELQRSMKIALYYGIRLGANPEIVKHLTVNYPSHSFVIDYDEACKLFGNVREPKDYENFLKENLKAYFLEQYGIDLTHYPDHDSKKEAIGIIQLEEQKNVNKCTEKNTDQNKLQAKAKEPHNKEEKSTSIKN